MSSDHGHDAPKIESLHGPVLLALLMAGGLAYYFLDRPHHPDEREEATTEGASTPRFELPPRPSAPLATPPSARPAAPAPPLPAPPPGGPDCVANIETDPP